MTAEHLRPSALTCAIDKQPIIGHARCRRCTILVGPGHYDATTSYGMCFSCEDALIRIASSSRTRPKSKAEEYEERRREERAEVLELFEEGWPLLRIKEHFQLRSIRQAEQWLAKARIERHKIDT